MCVRMGYVDDFPGANTILLCGDDEGLLALANQLGPLEDRDTQPVNLHSLPFVQVYGGVSLVAHPVDRELGIRRIGLSPTFAWHHSEEGWLESAEKIEVVARRGGHCYLGAILGGRHCAGVPRRVRRELVDEA
jgi:hypothetical protein